MKPILKYPGAKWRLTPWILCHMPPHVSYLEPYAGSLAVLLNKPKCRFETANDLNGEIVNFFKICRDCPEEMAELLALTPWAREERDAAFDPTNDPVERARRFAVRTWMTFGAGISKSNGWRHTTGKGTGGPDNPKLWRRMPEVVREAATRLIDVQIENRPAIEVISKHNGEGILIYADPPYMPSTRTAHGRVYTHEMTETDHAELLTALKQHSGMVMLSGYDCEMYRDMLDGWRCVTTKTQAENGAKRVECLWINSQAVKALTDITGYREVREIVEVNRRSEPDGVVEGQIGLF